MRFLTRLTSWLHRFTVAIATLGIVNACKIFSIARWSDRRFRLMLPNRFPFEFRGQSDQGVISHFYKNGYYIEDTADQRILRIIDGGANVGDETARFAIHYPDAEIVAVEPESDNFGFLQRNFAAVDRITTLKGAIWPRQTHLQIISDQSGATQAFRVIETRGNDGDIDAWSITSLMQRMNWDAIDILKLDIEGAEYELFTDSYQQWIGSVKAIVFEVPDNDRPGATQAIFRAIGDEHFNSYICGENLVLIRANVPWRLKQVVGFRGMQAVSLM